MRKLHEPFVITDGVKPLFDDYHFQRLHFQAESSTARAFRAGAQLEVGGFYDGTLTQAILYVRLIMAPGRDIFFIFNQGVIPSLAEAQSWRAPIDNSVTLKLQWNFYL